MRSRFFQEFIDKYRINRYALDERFVLKDGKIHPCAIVVPGGGYGIVCNHSEGVTTASELNKLGISCVIVYYRVRHLARFPNPQDDLARAVKEIFARKDELKLDMSSYSIWGYSAGGHLVGSFGTTSMGYKKYNLPKPSLLVLAYPVITLEKEITHLGTRENLIGKNANEEEALDKSIHTNVDKDYPPTFVWCGNIDSLVPMVNTELMTEALKKNNIPHVSKIYDNVDHGVNIGTGTNAEGWVNDAVKFWKSLL